jgi:hypothetical protein
VIATPIDCKASIDLRKRCFGRSGRIVASCSLDLSSATDKGELHVYLKRRPPPPTVFIQAEISLDLKNDANDKFGELAICVAFSRASPINVIQSADRATQELESALTRAHDVNTNQATAALAAQMTLAWQSLLSRLEALVKIADIVAEVRFIPNSLCPTTTNLYLQTGSPLDQVGMGCRLSSI